MRKLNKQNLDQKSEILFVCNITIKLIQNSVKIDRNHTQIQPKIQNPKLKHKNFTKTKYTFREWRSEKLQSSIKIHRNHTKIPPKTKNPKLKHKNFKRRKYTFRNGVLNFRTFGNNAVITETLFLLNKAISDAIFGVVPTSTGIKLYLRDDEPLDEREGDSDDCAHRNQNLRAQIWKKRRPHCLSLPTREREGGRERERDDNQRG